MRSRPIRLSLVLLAVVGVVVATLACARATEEEGPKLSSVRIASGSVGGDFFAYGEALANVWGQELNLSVDNSPSTGSVENVRLLRGGEIDVAPITSKFGGYARQGIEQYEGDEPYPGLRAIGGIFTFSWGSWVLKSSGLTSIEGLAGQGRKIKVAMGPDPSVTEPDIRPTYEAHGVDWENDIEPFVASYEDAYRLLGDGNIDVFEGGIGGLVPEPGLLEIAASREVLLLEVDADLMRQAGLSTTLIPAGSVPGAETDTYGFLFGTAILATTDRVSDDDAYRLTKVWHENLERVAELTPAAQEAIANPKLLTKDVEIVYHPGAIRYWEEIGLWGQ
ncbi:MAG: TAXI family TRAP transporter solute-binding subunit [Dehalococcoidia bacterium]